MLSSVCSRSQVPSGDLEGAVAVWVPQFLAAQWSLNQQAMEIQNMCVCVYRYINIDMNLHVYSLSLYIYISLYVHMYIYIYTYTATAQAARYWFPL